MKLAEAMALANEGASRPGKPFGVFLACGFTPQHARTFLMAHLARRLPDRNVDVKTGLYGDLTGNLEKLDPRQVDAAAVVIEWGDLDPRLGYRSSHGWDPSHMEDILATAGRRLDHLRKLVDAVAAHVPVAVALPSLPLLPAFKTPPVWGDPVALALREKVYGFAAAGSGASVRVLDPQRLDLLSPPGLRADLRSEFRWGFPYRVEHACALGDLLAQLVSPAPPKKGLITDLDDTLWRGLLGEDGVEGVSWDLDHSGGGCALYQRMLASLAGAGVLLGVATKNDPRLVEQALARKDLIVPGRAFFPVESHWGPKSESVSRILKAWNIDADSVVFIDDSPMEIAEATGAFPSLTGLAYPASEDQIGAFLDRLRDLFGKSSVAEEDRLRLDSLRSAPRPDAGSTGASTEDFLSRMEAEITLSCDRPDQRAFDLINKTNQFNLNGRRIDDSEWRRRTADPRRFLVSVSYRDKFGSLGKIAVVSGTRDPAEPGIDIWVMSCRAFSRRIEHRVLGFLFERLGVDTLRLDLAATDRNSPMREFLKAVSGQETDGTLRISRAQFLSRCPPLFGRIQVE